MYPYGPHYSGHWYRGPRRLLWFFIGAATATWWIKCKEMRQEWSRRSSHCIRAPIQPPVLSSNTDTDPWSARGVTRAINGLPPAELSTQMDDWSDEKKRMAEISQSAGDKLTELSEATLDTVLTTVEVLKAKLAEHRAEVNKQREEEKRKPPPRLV